MLQRAGAGRCAHELAGGDGRSLLRLCLSSEFLPQAPMTESLRDAPACSDGASPESRRWDGEVGEAGMPAVAVGPGPQTTMKRWARRFL